MKITASICRCEVETGEGHLVDGVLRPVPAAIIRTIPHRRSCTLS
jgi:hypothetical protein